MISTARAPADDAELLGQFSASLDALAELFDNDLDKGRLMLGVLIGRTNTRRLAISHGLSQTTAHRRVNELIASGLLARKAARRLVVTPKGRDHLAPFLQTLVLAAL